MPTESGISIDITNLRKEYDSIAALDGIDLDIEEPQIVGLVGPNGAGKTTLIQSLLGLLEPTAGATRLNGTPSLELGQDDRARIGYMPQEEAVYRDLTVRENVEFFASLYRVDDRKAAVDHALEFVGLRDRANSRIGELSGGMIRRTSLACTLVSDPDVLFLDEPTVGLDPKLRADMWDRFRERRDQGTLLMVSTHYLGEAHNCDRVLFLRDGRVLTFDEPEVLLEQSGVSNMEEAFLSLLEADDRANDSGGKKPLSADGVGYDGGTNA